VPLPILPAELEPSVGGAVVKRHQVRPDEIDLLKGMLIMCPTQRLTAKQVLQHPYVKTSMFYTSSSLVPSLFRPRFVLTGF
jgi:serine/threonine protein kinase